MDEPWSALDPVAALRVEEPTHELASIHAIAIVTHNMLQAARLSGYTAMMMLGEGKASEMVEYDETHTFLARPGDPRTEGYVTGRFR